MGGAPDPKGSVEYSDMSRVPGGADYLNNTLGGLYTLTSNFSNAVRGESGKAINNDFMRFNPTLNANFQQYNPSLNTEFTGPQFGNKLDSFSQNIVSQGVGDAASRLAATNRGIASQFGSRNPALARILQAQAGIQSQLGTNPLMFQAATAQRAREGQEYQLGQQAQALTNAARLAQGQEGARLQTLGNQAQLQQTEASANLQGLGNAANIQRAQWEMMPLQANQNLLATLAGLGSTLGRTVQPLNNPAAQPGASSPNNAFKATNGY